MSMTEGKLDPMGEEYMLKHGSSPPIADALISGSAAGYSKERDASIAGIGALGQTGCLATIKAVADALGASPERHAYAVGFVSGIRRREGGR